MIRGNIRTESGTLKDVQAMIAVCRAGEAYVPRDPRQVRPRHRARRHPRLPRAVRAAHPRRAGPIPAGIYRAVAHFDNDGISLDQPVRVEMAITVGDGAMTVDFTGSEPAGGGPLQLWRRHHDQRVPAPHQVPDHAARPGRRGLLPAAASASSRARSVLAGRGARADRALLRADQPADRAGPARARARPCPTASRPAPTATRCRRSPSGTHPETGRLFIQGDLNAGGTGARPAFDGESAMIIFAGSTARNNPVEVVESRLPLPCASCATASDRTPAAPDATAAASASSAVYEFLAPAFITFSLERKVDAALGARGRAGRRGQRGGDHLARRGGAARAQGDPASDRGAASACAS